MSRLLPRAQHTPGLEGGDKRQFYSVLRLGGIRSPLDAVRAAIVAEARSQR